MERVTGIGGFFFAARDPDTLSRWYATHLGVGAPPQTDGEQEWTQTAGPTVFAPFGSEHADSPHLGPAGWGINFRVDDLDAMVEQLTAAGIEVEVDPEDYAYGRFASVIDPEGNPVQLWQPATGPDRGSTSPASAVDGATVRDMDGANAMETLSEATTRLARAGYESEFQSTGGRLVCSSCGTDHDPAEVTIDEIVRFEGASDPGDEAIVYAIDAGCGHKGVFIAAFGPDATPDDIAVVRALPDRTHP